MQKPKRWLWNHRRDRGRVAMVALAACALGAGGPVVAVDFSERAGFAQGAGRTSTALVEAAKRGALGILTPGSSGSGLIVGRRGNTYLFATARHVMPSMKQGDEYTVFSLATGSARQYSVTGLVDGPELQGIDIVFGTFETRDELPVIPVGVGLGAVASGARDGDQIAILGVSVPNRSVTVPILRPATSVIQAHAPGNQNGYELLYEAATVPGMSGGGLFEERSCPVSYLVGNFRSRLGTEIPLPPKDEGRDLEWISKVWGWQWEDIFRDRRIGLALRSPYVVFADPMIGPFKFEPESAERFVLPSGPNPRDLGEFWITRADQPAANVSRVSGRFTAPMPIPTGAPNYLPGTGSQAFRRYETRRASRPGIRDPREPDPAMSESPQTFRQQAMRFVRRDSGALQARDADEVYADTVAMLSMGLKFPYGAMADTWNQIGWPVPSEGRTFPIAVGVHGMSEEYPAGGRSGVSLGIPFELVKGFLAKNSVSYGIAMGQEAYASVLRDYCVTDEVIQASLYVNNWRLFEAKGQLTASSVGNGQPTSSKEATAMNDLAFLLAEFEVNQGEAVGLARKAVAAEPNNAFFIDTLAWSFFKNGETEAARSMIAKAVGLRPDLWEAQDHYGDILIAAGQGQLAISAWQRALVGQPTLDSRDRSRIEDKIKKARGGR